MIVGSYATETVDGNSMKLYVAKPEGSGPFPAVVLAYHRGAFDDFTIDRADKLAQNGFIAVVPDLFHRYPDAENPLTMLDDQQVKADVLAAAAHAKALPDCNGRLGIAGHCMGGRVAFYGAEISSDFSAAAAFYYGNMFKVWGHGDKTPFDMLDRISCPVIAFSGNDDKNPSPEDTQKIEAELNRLGIENEFHRYDGAGHAFQNFLSKEAYRPEAEKDSWGKAIAFLKARLG